MKSLFYIIFILYIISINTKDNEIEENSSPQLYIKFFDINNNENLLQTDNNENLNLYKITTTYSQEELKQLFSLDNINSLKKKNLKKIKKEIKEEKKLHKKEDKLLVEQMENEKNSTIIKKPLDEYIQKENENDKNKFLSYKITKNDLTLNEESFSYFYSILLFLIVIGLLLLAIQFIIDKNENLRKKDQYIEFEDKLLKGY